ncbi:MAG: protein kinase, partial [Candidatus Solibacter usitatus]|nr:protein kinase [Candidatus Solibacter usitatus]
KLTQPETSGADDSNAPTVAAATAAGTVLGTMGYMSPEQVRGRPADHRSDIFSFGAILYEMLAGKRLFRGDTAADTMTAVLKEEPPPLEPPALDRVVRRCLEKNVRERFQSASDLGFALESLAGFSTAAAVPQAVALAPPTRRLPLWAPVSIALAATLALGHLAGRQIWKAPAPSFQRLSFRRGVVQSARFAPDGQTVVYSAAWEGNAVEPFSTRAGGVESRPLRLAGHQVLAISAQGEMAVLLNRRMPGHFVVLGTLARVSLSGGEPREILGNVQAADWAPDGSNVAIVRDSGGRNRLEFPIGKVLYESPGYLTHPRVSPKGDRIAFLDHPIPEDDGGSVAVVDLAGNKKTLSSGWVSEWGLAWSPGGEEVWFAGTRTGSSRALYAVTLSGRERLVLREAGTLTLHDLSRNGRALLGHESFRSGTMCLAPGQANERDMSWLDYSIGMDLSADGRTLLFTETGEGGGGTYASYIRSTDGGPAVRLGEGEGTSLSPDGKWAIIIPHPARDQLTLVPTGAGEIKKLARGGFSYAKASWFADGQRMLLLGSEPGHGLRAYVQDLAGARPRPITPEGIGTTWFAPISPDGAWVAAMAPDRKVVLYPVAGGEPRPVPGLTAGENPVRFSPDGRFLYVILYGVPPVRVDRVELTSGKREPWRKLAPADPAGIIGVAPVQLTPDGKSYFYGYMRQLSDLVQVEGLK